MIGECAYVNQYTPQKVTKIHSPKMLHWLDAGECASPSVSFKPTIETFEGRRLASVNIDCLPSLCGME